MRIEEADASKRCHQDVRKVVEASLDIKDVLSDIIDNFTR